MKHAFTFIAALLSILGTATSVFPWNRAGHMVTGAIAYQVLKQDDDKTIGTVIALLKKHPDLPRWDKLMEKLKDEDRDLFLFMMAARWADDARDSRTFYPSDLQNDKLHYINLPFLPDGHPDNIKPAPPDDNNILRGFEDKRSIVKGDGKRGDRAVALTWIFHLVGDVHQPLHTTSLFTAQFPMGDRGGTRFYIRAKEGREPISLHKYWDDLILGSDGFQDVRNKATALRLRKEFAREKLTELAVVEFQHWAVKESLPLAREVVYRHGKLDGSADRNEAPTLPADYAKTVQPIAERRAVLAGYRLAAVLQDALE